jgi:hypothetical protein
MANIGASAVFTSVSPVLPSRPASGAPVWRESSTSAGSDAPMEGVKLTYGKPARSAA